MKKIFSITTVLLLTFFSCEKDNKTAVSNNAPIEIEFIKHGDLEFLVDGNVVKTIAIEIADNDNARARGLMDRSRMDENNGMLFIFGDDEVRQQTFYMKNTRIPLDIMYFSPDTVLLNTSKNAQPNALTIGNNPGEINPSSAPSKFVVEINGGLSAKWGLAEGKTKVRWKRTN